MQVLAQRNWTSKIKWKEIATQGSPQIEGLLQETPTQLDVMDSAARKNLYLNNLVGFYDLLWLLWHGKKHVIFFFSE